MEEPLCQQCGSAIPGPHYPSHPRKFCGNPCKFAFQKANPPRPPMPRVTQPCANPGCGQEVSYLPSQRGAGRTGTRRYKGRAYSYSDRVYCSVDCKHAGQSVVMTGRRPSNGNYSNRNTFRSMIRREFHDRCAICGWNQASCDVCHIVARKNGGDDTLENVVMLCPNDHRLFDMGRIPVDVIRRGRADILR